MTQSWTTKIERDASPNYTENKRTAVKNSVTRPNARKSERDEGGGGKSESKKAASRVTEFKEGPSESSPFPSQMTQLGKGGDRKH